MLLSFDVDCGEALPGHRFVARGLSGPLVLPLPVPSDDDDDDDGDDDEDPPVTPDSEPAEEYRSPEQVALDVDGRDGYPGFSLEYELVPGLPEGYNFFDALLGIWFEADVPLPWEPGDSGALAPFKGGVSTHGSRGAWPLPPDAQVLTFTLHPPLAMQGASLGRLVVQLESGDAHWMATDAEG